MSQIKNWDKIKKESRWVNTVCTVSQDPYSADHVDFGFTTRNLHDILYFSFTLLDEKADLIDFPSTEKKVKIIM